MRVRLRVLRFGSTKNHTSTQKLKFSLKRPLPAHLVMHKILLRIKLNYPHDSICRDKFVVGPVKAASMDISGGKELNPIPAVNAVDESLPRHTGKSCQSSNTYG